MSDARCAGCGLVIEPGEQTVEISEGTFAEAKTLTESEQWGLMHRSCFNLSIDSPESVLEEIRRQANE